MKNQASTTITNTNKLISSTPTTPEKHSDGKFITATSGRPTMQEPSENLLARKYEQQSIRTFRSLPKRMKHITASISHCHHTNTKVSMGTSFNNCPELTAFIKSEHPIFSKDLPLATAIKIYGKSKTSTERYIAMTAVLVKSKIIDTVDCGLCLDSSAIEFLRPSFEALLAVLNQCLAFKFKLPIDSLLIDSQNQCNFKRIMQQIKDTSQAIDSATFAAGGTRLLPVDSKQTKQLQLDDEVALEKELSKILSGYNIISSKDGTSIKYTKELNRWTRRTLNRSDMTDEQITMAMRILNTSPSDLRSGTVEAVLPTVKESLCYEDEASRRNSAIVIRHLEYKIELQLACLHRSKFLVDVAQEEARFDKAATKYITKTKAVQDDVIQSISKKSSSALAILRKRMGVK